MDIITKSFGFINRAPCKKNYVKNDKVTNDCFFS